MNISCCFRIAFILIASKEAFSFKTRYNNVEKAQAKSVFGRNKRQITDFDDTEVSRAKGQKNKKCFGQFCLPKDYDSLVSPLDIDSTNDTKKIVDVNFDFDIRVFEVDDIKFTVSFTMYFGIRWEEPRLLKKNISKSYDDTFQRVNLDMLKHLWLPSIYILNLKSYKTLNVLSEFAGNHIVYPFYLALQIIIFILFFK